MAAVMNLGGRRRARQRRTAVAIAGANARTKASLLARALGRHGIRAAVLRDDDPAQDDRWWQILVWEEDEARAEPIVLAWVAEEL